MPYVDTVGDILRVTIAATYPDGQLQLTSVNYICTASGGGDTRAALGANLYNGIGTNWLPMMAPTSSLYGYKVSLVNRKPAPLPKVLAAIQAGTGSGNTMPTQSRPLISTGTGNAGRAYRGRMFLFTPASNQISATSFLSTAALTALGNIAGSVFNSFASGGTTWQPVIAHRHAGPPVTWSWDPMTSGQAQSKIATQRRSGNYGRTNSLVPW